jgi:phage terminase large subunit
MVGLAMIDIQLPHNNWLPRAHQVHLWRHLQAGGKRALAVWHRRAGKDEICLHHAATSMIKRPGNYWHCLPEYSMARRAIWTSVNSHTGKRRIDEAFPHAMRESTNDQEMFIRAVNGSTFQLIGSDRYDQAVGAGVAGLTFSEWALANPSAWGYFRPMVEENQGWAVFITTPRGRNHAHSLFKHASHSADWFCELLTARDTGTLSSDQLEEALNEYMALYGEDVGRAQFQQEYMCDWNAAILGAFYSLECAKVRNEDRVLQIEALPNMPVHRAWDLGVGDDTSIWWFQPIGSQLAILDHYAASGVGLEHYRDVIEQRERQHGWINGIDYVPHDAMIKEWGSGRTRIETMQEMNLHPALVPKHSIDDGINAVRRTLTLCIFHPRTEEGGLSALEQYRREWDDQKKAFRASAVHDWTSHPADSFRYLAMSWRPPPVRRPREPRPQGEGWCIIPPPREVRPDQGIRL